MNPEPKMNLFVVTSYLYILSSLPIWSGIRQNFFSLNGLSLLFDSDKDMELKKSQ